MGNQDMFKALHEILQEEIRIYRTLIDLLQQEQKELIQADIEAIEQVVKQKETIHLKVKLIEETRVALAQKICSCFGLTGGDVTLTQIIQTSEDPDRENLSRCQAELRELVTTVSNLSKMNQRLVGQSLEFLRGSISLLNHLSGLGSVYQPNGQVTTGDNVSRVVNQKA